MSSKITKRDIELVQKAWGKSVVNLGKLFLQKMDVKAAAEKHVELFYNYPGTVLFKPTKVNQIQFRKTFEGAVSYFIGENINYPEDHGFALQPWTNVRFENSEFIFSKNTAQTMGNYFFTDLNGNETKVEYTFGYILSEDRLLKINLHHSSIPFG